MDDRRARLPHTNGPQHVVVLAAEATETRGVDLLARVDEVDPRKALAQRIDAVESTVKGNDAFNAMASSAPFQRRKTRLHGVVPAGDHGDHDG